MAGNTTGQLFRVTTFGESHGLAFGYIVDGVLPGISLTEADPQRDLDRHRLDTSCHATQRHGPDQVKILSRVFGDVTIGTSIGLLIRNTGRHSQDCGAIKGAFRPKYADYTCEQEYSLRDYRGGGCSSIRETMMRVMAGAIAKRYPTGELGVEIRDYLTQMGDILLEIRDWSRVGLNPLFCLDSDKLETLNGLIRGLRKEGDSIGAKVTVVTRGIPAGLGEPVLGHLGAGTARTLMNINATKGVGIGDGFDVVVLRSDQNRDEITKEGLQSNHAGGVLGGISSGQQIVVRTALKPTPSITIPRRTINHFDEEVKMITKSRHDPCVGVCAVPIAEVVLATVLMDHLLRQRTQNANVKTDIPRW